MKSMHDLMKQLREANGSKIVMLVADGLGGLPIEPGGKTELETARDAQPRRARGRGNRRPEHAGRAGITPGSGPGHLGLFGFDPLEHDIGRGVLEALGLGVEVGPQGRRDPRQLLHDRRRRQRHRPPRRANPHRDLRDAGRQAPRRRFGSTGSRP